VNYLLSGFAFVFLAFTTLERSEGVNQSIENVPHKAVGDGIGPVSYVKIRFQISAHVQI
jgi:hypothetical protein